jgi:uncharacterized protein (TIGR03083 family)
MPGDQELVDRLDEVWASTDELGAGLDQAAWDLPTDCPGWSVQDQLAHVVHVEGRLLGRPEIDDELPESLPHVRNTLGRINEVFVADRRPWRGADVLAEFHEVTRQRVAVLRSCSAGDFAADSWTPVGPGTVRDLLPFRMFDSWVHEQDMRRAVGRPGDLDTPVADECLGMMAAAMPFVVGKQASAPEGSVVVFWLTAPLAREVVVGVVDGRGTLLAAAPDEESGAPRARLVMSTETFARLGCGRIRGDDALAGGDVTIDGDLPFGRSVVGAMNYMF